MPVPLLPLALVGSIAGGSLLAGGLIGSGEAAENLQPDPVPPTPETGSGGFELSPAILIAGFIAVLIFGRTAIQEVL